MTTDPATHLADHLASELRSAPFTPALTDDERLARLRAARAATTSGPRTGAVDLSRTLTGLGLVAAAVTATVLIVNVVSTSTASLPADAPAPGDVQVATPDTQTTLEVPADRPTTNDRYPVPTWTSDGTSRMALISGRLGGALVGDTVCLWIEDGSGDRTGLVLESGSTAQLGPLRLIGPGGLVIAEDGDVIQGSGGLTATPPPACEDLASSGATLSAVTRVTTQ